MNSVNLSGRLAMDPEVVEYGKGKDKHQMARFRIASCVNSDLSSSPRILPSLITYIRSHMFTVSGISEEIITIPIPCWTSSFMIL